MTRMKGYNSLNVVLGGVSSRSSVDRGYPINNKTILSFSTNDFSNHGLTFLQNVPAQRLQETLEALLP